MVICQAIQALHIRKNYGTGWAIFETIICRNYRKIIFKTQTIIRIQESRRSYIQPSHHIQPVCHTFGHCIFYDIV